MPIDIDKDALYIFYCFLNQCHSVHLRSWIQSIINVYRPNASLIKVSHIVSSRTEHSLTRGYQKTFQVMWKHSSPTVNLTKCLEIHLSQNVTHRFLSVYLDTFYWEKVCGPEFLPSHLRKAMLVKFVEYQHLIERGLIWPNDNFQMGLFQKCWCTSDGNLELRPIAMHCICRLPPRFLKPDQYMSIYSHIHTSVYSIRPLYFLPLGMYTKSKAAGTLEGSVYKI